MKSEEIESVDDREQTRSLICTLIITGMRMWASDYTKPLVDSEIVGINQLIDIVKKLLILKVEEKYDLTKPQGAWNSDNTLLRKSQVRKPSVSCKKV